MDERTGTPASKSEAHSRGLTIEEEKVNGLRHTAGRKFARSTIGNVPQIKLSGVTNVAIRTLKSCRLS